MCIDSRPLQRLPISLLLSREPYPECQMRSTRAMLRSLLNDKLPTRSDEKLDFNYRTRRNFYQRGDAVHGSATDDLSDSFHAFRRSSTQ